MAALMGGDWRALFPASGSARWAGRQGAAASREDRLAEPTVGARDRNGGAYRKGRPCLSGAPAARGGC
jgi:hypothetical protein